MKDFTRTRSGIVSNEWIDVNGHMNVVHYMALFDQASDVMVNKIGITSETISQGEPTVVAGRILVSHRRELMLGEEYEVWSGLSAIDPGYFTFTHRLTVAGRVRATCEIRAKAFCPKTRQATQLSETILSEAQQYLIPGIKDSFEVSYGN